MGGGFGYVHCMAAEATKANSISHIINFISCLLISSSQKPSHPGAFYTLSSCPKGELHLEDPPSPVGCEVLRSLS